MLKFCFMMLYLLKMRMQYFMLVEMVFKFYFDFGIFNLSSSKGLLDNGYYINTLTLIKSDIICYTTNYRF